MQAKLYSQEKKEESTDRELLQDKLIIIRQCLFVVLGAVLMFLVIGFIKPEIMEVDPIPQIWILLMLAPIIAGIYLLVSSTWRKLPLIKRRNTALGGIALGLLAFSFLPLWLLRHGVPEAIPYIFLVILGGFGLNWTYNKIGRSTEIEFKHDDLDIFP